MRVAVVGSGPSGMYAAARLAADDRVTGVDILDASPTPYGLVRFGVAPDHHKATSVSAIFARTLADPKVRLLGNVRVGDERGGVTRAELLERYDVVIYAIGVDRDRELGVPGVVGSLGLVRWYTGLPGAQPPADLYAVHAAVVVGAGNVAIDIARLLLHDRAVLARSTMPEEVLTAFVGAPVEHVHIVVRRTAADVKFSSPELHELMELPDLAITLDPATLPDPPTDPVGKVDRHVAQRLSALAAGAARTDRGTRALTLHFESSVVATQPRDGGLLESVTIDRAGRPQLVVPAQLAVSAIGYAGSQVEGLPYDAATGTIPNQGGLIIGNAPDVHGREYVVGWAGRGPTGVIGTNKHDAATTVETLWSTLAKDPAVVAATQGKRSGEIADLLAERGVQVVGADDLARIDAAERDLGRDRQAPSVRIHDLDTLMRTAHGEG